MRSLGRRHSAEWILVLYPMVVQIAAEEEALEDAMPRLTALALKYKTMRVNLVNVYMSLRPEQLTRCPVCLELVQTDNFCQKMCVDCALDQYVGSMA